MEITSWTLYWIIKLDALRDFLILVSLPLGVVASLLNLVGGSDYPFQNWKPKKLLWFLPCLSLILIGKLTPTTKQMCAIYVIPRIVNNEQVQKIPTKLLKLADDWIKELSPKAKNNQ